VAFNPDGRHLATANGNGTVYVLRLPPAAWKAAGEGRAEPFGEIRRFEGHTHFVIGVAFGGVSVPLPTPIFAGHSGVGLHKNSGKLTLGNVAETPPIPVCTPVRA
jgi:hypothetical protein